MRKRSIKGHFLPNDSTKEFRICKCCHNVFFIYKSRLREKSNRGRFCSRECTDKFKKITGMVAGTNNPAWTGDDASYDGFHRWIRRKFKKTGKCSRCGGYSSYINGREGTHWALKNGRQYSRNINDYLELCAKCHSNYDWGKWTDEKGEKHPMYRIPEIGIIDI